jgi:hypothetical protein
MDNQEIIALSRIATIISEEKIFLTDNNSIWDKILSNAGQSGLFSQYDDYLKPYSYNYSGGRTYENPNPRFGGFFSAIKSILNKVYHDGIDNGEFNKLMATIAENINPSMIFDGDIDELNEGSMWDKYYTFESFLNKQDEETINNVLREKTTEEYKEFLLSLQVLNFDLTFKNKKFVLAPYTESLSDGQGRNVSSIVRWLTTNHPDIVFLYNEAVRNYIDGNVISCITSCRSLITGLFSKFQNDGQDKWLRGLQNFSRDMNVDKVTPKEITGGVVNTKYVFPNGGQFNYPRFMFIYGVYKYTCDLGAHALEAPMIDGNLQTETTTVNDALLALRTVEDIIVWVKNDLSV